MLECGIIFTAVGAIFLSIAIFNVIKQRKIIANGRLYTGKIFKHIEDYTIIVNNMPQVNICVRYFDQNHVVREAVIPTRFAYGTNKFPIGMTIDFYEYNGQYMCDKNSLRAEILSGEEDLMDEKPLEPGQVKYVAVTCPNCSGTFKAAVGYASKCPNCGTMINA